MNRDRYKTNLLFVLLLVTWTGSLCAVQQYRQKILSLRPIAETYLIPRAELLKVVSLGYDPLVSDWMWLKTIATYGARNADPATYPYLYRMADVITDLDPEFRKVYLYSSLLLAFYSEHVQKSNALLEKAILQFPNDWWFYFNLGFNHFYFLGDLQTAAGYISKAAGLPGHPAYLPKFAASLYAGMGDFQAALQFLYQMYESTEDEEVRRTLLEKIRELEQGKLPEGMQRHLQEEGPS
ncbi:MAG: hypothetical protein HY538_06135 [Deltaproteobacteria bacterium]|nr:hypothetical protein [Deltaproteobacteria bacterium]